MTCWLIRALTAEKNNVNDVRLTSGLTDDFERFINFHSIPASRACRIQKIPYLINC